jgi:hypothetical protein
VVLFLSFRKRVANCWRAADCNPIIEVKHLSLQRSSAAEPQSGALRLRAAIAFNVTDLAALFAGVVVGYLDLSGKFLDSDKLGTQTSGISFSPLDSDGRMQAVGALSAAEGRFEGKAWEPSNRRDIFA